jgi:hypothetical protein
MSVATMIWLVAITVVLTLILTTILLTCACTLYVGFWVKDSIWRIFGG